MRDIIDLIGRIMLSTIFLFEAWDSSARYGRTLQTMTQYGVVNNQELLLRGAIALLTVGGLMVLFGYRTTLGSLLLLGYWLPKTFLIHDFWNFPKDQLRDQSIYFMQDIAIMGGLLMLMGKGSGRYSIKRLLATTRVR
jgi:putative oxidoreductase